MAHDIYTSAQQCKDLFTQYLAHPRTYSKQVSQCRHRFLAWASFLGVFADPDVCLDARLRDAPELKDLVLSMLRVLRRNLNRGMQDHVPTSGSSADDVVAEEDRVMYGISGSIDRLHRLAIAIRRPLRTDEVERVETFAEKRDPDDFDKVIAAIIDFLFGAHAPQPLRDQLTRSILYRRNRLLYQRKHQAKLEKERPTETTHDFPSVPEEVLGVPRTVPVAEAQLEGTSPNPRKQVHFSAETAASKTEPSKRIYAMLPLSEAGSSGEKELNWDTSTTYSSNPVGKAFYPSPPKVLPDQVDAKCQFCSLLLPASSLANPRWWRSHVDRDLRPYVCISEKCGNFPPSFATRAEWRTHMEQVHRDDWAKFIHRPVNWFCTLEHQPPQPFNSKEELLRHLSEEHPELSSNEQQLDFATRSEALEPRKTGICPICGEDFAADTDGQDLETGSGADSESVAGSTQLSKHVAVHLHHVAFLSIRWWDDDVAMNMDVPAEDRSTSGRGIGVNSQGTISIAPDIITFQDLCDGGAIVKISPSDRFLLLRLKEMSMPFDEDRTHEFISQGRLEGTCEWLLRHPEFREWEFSNSSSLFLLDGRIGTGKTTLTSKVIDHIRGEIEASGSPEGFGYIYIHLGRDWSLPDFLWNLVVQLASPAIPDAVRYIRTSLGQKLKANGINPNSPRIAVELEDELVSSINLYPRSTLVIDGLDTSILEDHLLLSQSLDRLLLKAVRPLRIFLTSRRKRPGLSAATKERVKVIKLEIQEKYNREDIGKLITHYRRDPDLKSKLSHLSEASFLGYSGGMFLWAATQLKALTLCSTEEEFRRCQIGRPLDSQLSQIYGHIFSENISSCLKNENSLERKFRSIGKLIMACVMVAGRPLTTSQVSQMLVTQELDYEFFGRIWKLLVRDLVVFNPTTETWEFAHFSVGQYVQEELCSVQEGHAILATICLKCMANPDLRAADLLLYANVHWVTHVQLSAGVGNVFSKFSEGGSGDYSGDFGLDSALMSFFGFFLLPAPPAYERWQAYLQSRISKSSERPVTSVIYNIDIEDILEAAPLVVACRFGMYDCLREWWNNPGLSIPLEQTNGRGDSLLALAAAGGSILICKRLLEAGMDVNAQTDGFYGRALIAAAFWGRIGVVALLAGAGASLDTVMDPRKYMTPTVLAAAAGGGHLETLQFLIDLGAEVNNRWIFHTSYTALYYAAFWGRLDCVTVLVGAGAQLVCDPSKLPLHRDPTHLERCTATLEYQATAPAFPDPAWKKYPCDHRGEPQLWRDKMEVQRWFLQRFQDEDFVFRIQG